MLNTWLVFVVHRVHQIVPLPLSTLELLGGLLGAQLGLLRVYC